MNEILSGLGAYSSGSTAYEADHSSGESLTSPVIKKARMIAETSHEGPSQLESTKSKPPSPAPYTLLLKCDEKAVNMGICFWNPEKDTYYVKARKACPFNQLPKEIVHMCLERRARAPKYKSVEFFITGKFLYCQKINQS